MKMVQKNKKNNKRAKPKRTKSDVNAKPKKFDDFDNNDNLKSDLKIETEHKNYINGKRSKALVLVLGDIGCSPRMQYHSLSLANIAGMNVDFVGYPGSSLPLRIENHPHINPIYLSPWKYKIPKYLYLFIAPLKVFYQLFQLFWTLLFTISRPDLILIQNPPSIPSLLVAQIVAALRGSNLIIDWHNFGYTILGMNLGKKHILVRLSYWYERFFGKGAHANICVTKSMKEFLINEWGISASVVYDRPPEHFRRLSLNERHKLFLSLSKEYKLRGIDWGEDMNKNNLESKEEKYVNYDSDKQENRTLISYFDEKKHIVKERIDRPGIVVSSTSWTVDEDFGILLHAILSYENFMRRNSGMEEVKFTVKSMSTDSEYNENEHLLPHYSNKNREKEKKLFNLHKFPKLMFIITGRGPLKEAYQKQIDLFDLKFTRIVTAFLKSEDYPLLLGSADLGVSLHVSSSNLDLPMKVVDMFGCCLPVCAIHFKCLGELVQNRENGLIFKNSTELFEKFLEVFSDFPNDTKLLDDFREDLNVRFKTLTWEMNWKKTVLPILGKL